MKVIRLNSTFPRISGTPLVLSSSGFHQIGTLYVFLGISVLTGFKAGDGEWWVGENGDVM